MKVVLLQINFIEVLRRHECHIGAVLPVREHTVEVLTDLLAANEPGAVPGPVPGH